MKLRELSPEFVFRDKDEQQRIHQALTRLDAGEKHEYESRDTVRKEQKPYGITLEHTETRIKRAKDDGFIVITGTESTLLLDLDADAVINETALDCLCDVVSELPLMVKWKSKSGGTHVVLHFLTTTFSEAEAVAMEGALGSDAKRVVLYIMSLQNGVKRPRILFMPREVAMPYFGGYHQDEHPGWEEERSPREAVCA